MRRLFLALLFSVAIGAPVFADPPELIVAPRASNLLAKNILTEFGAVCNGTDTTLPTIDDQPAFARAAAWASTNGGAFIAMPPGQSCGLASGFNVTSNFTVFGTLIGGSTGHDIGGQNNGPSALVAINGFTGTLATVAAPAGGSNQALTGSGFRGVSFKSGGTASNGLVMNSVRQAVCNDLYLEEFSSAGFTFNAAVLGEAADVQGLTCIGINGRQINKAAPIVRLGGTATANHSMNTFIGLRGQYNGAPAVSCDNADNVTFISPHFTRPNGSTVFAVDLTNSSTGYCRDIKFFGLSAPGGLVARGGAQITIGGTVTAGDVLSATFTSSLITGSPVTVSYTAAGGDTSTLEATGLKAAINANAALTAAGITATSSNAVISIPWAGGGTRGTGTVAFSVTGAATETGTLVPSDGGMVATAVTGIAIFGGPDVTNSDPLPVSGFGAQVLTVRENGAIYGAVLVSPIFVTSMADYAAALAQAQATSTLSPNLGLFYNGAAIGNVFATGSARCIVGMTSAGNYSIRPNNNCSQFDLSSIGVMNKVRLFTTTGGPTAVTSDYEIDINKASGAATPVALYASPASGSTLLVCDAKGDAAANNITITPAAGNIDGSATYVISTNYGCWLGRYNGTIWKTVGKV